MTSTPQIKNPVQPSAKHFSAIIWPQKNQDNDYWIKI